MSAPVITMAARLPVAEHAAFEKWRLSHPVTPTISQAIRQLIQIGLAAEKAKEKEKK